MLMDVVSPFVAVDDLAPLLSESFQFKSDHILDGIENVTSLSFHAKREAKSSSRKDLKVLLVLPPPKLPRMCGAARSQEP